MATPLMFTLLALVTLAGASANSGARSAVRSLSSYSKSALSHPYTGPLRSLLNMHGSTDSRRELQELASPGPPWTGIIAPCIYNSSQDNAFTACRMDFNVVVPLDQRTNLYYSDVGYQLQSDACHARYPITMPLEASDVFNETELDDCNGGVVDDNRCYIQNAYDKVNDIDFLICNTAFLSDDSYKNSKCPGSLAQKNNDCRALTRSECKLTPGCIDLLPIYLGDTTFDWLSAFFAQLTVWNGGDASPFLSRGFCGPEEAVVGLNLTLPGVATNLNNWFSTFSQAAFTDYSNSSVYDALFGTCPIAKIDWDFFSLATSCNVINTPGGLGLALNSSSIYTLNTTRVELCLAKGCSVGASKNNILPGQPLVMTQCFRSYQGASDWTVPDEHGNRYTGELSPVYEAGLNACYSYEKRWNKDACEGTTIDLSTLNSPSCPSPPPPPPPLDSSEESSAEDSSEESSEDSSEESSKDSSEESSKDSSEESSKDSSEESSVESSGI